MNVSSMQAGSLRPLSAALALFLVGTGPALAEPGLNLSGAPGVIDMPSGEALAKDRLSFSSAAFGGISRSTISFQAFDWLSGSFRTTSTKHWNSMVCPPDCTGDNALERYFERSLDLRFHVLDEQGIWPAVTIGVLDVLGSGYQSAEYIAATRHFGERVAVTAGLGWGRMASRGAIAAPFGARPPSTGAGFDLDRLFRGDVAPFAGVTWAVNDKWTAKLEYSSDGYAEEAVARGVFNAKSPFNVGLEYQQSPMLRFGAYVMQGSEIGLSAHIVLDPSQRPSGSVGGTGPTPVKLRVARSSDPDAWSSDWVTQDGVTTLLLDSMAKFVDRSGLQIEAVSVSADGQTAQVRVRGGNLDAEAQIVGRTVRAMSHVMPASVEVFEVVPMVGGIAASKVVVQRSDLEALEFAPDASGALRARVQIEDAGPRMPGYTVNEALYPDFKWSLAPYLRLHFLNDGAPVDGDVGVRLAASYQVAPGLTFSGAVTKSLFSNASAGASGVSGLQPVRSDADIYRANGDPALESLTLSWGGRLGKDLYGRVTAGYLEQMFGGVAAEVLYMPANQRWALGVEADAVAQRDTDGGFGFGEYDYATLSGHISGYYDIGGGYQAQLDLGRYLAGDQGGTLTVTRRFENGWSLAAYVTATDGMEAGTLDKGISMQIPVSWFTGQPNRATKPLEFHPYASDAGARLKMDGRLQDLLTDYAAPGLNEQWGRFWK